MSDFARKLIEENNRTRDTFLDLGNCALREIPEEIGDLDWLKNVSLASVWFKWDASRWQIQRSRNGRSRG